MGSSSRLTGLLALAVGLLVAAYVGYQAFQYFGEKSETVGESADGSIGAIGTFRADAQLCESLDVDCRSIEDASPVFMENALVTDESGAIRAEMLDETALTIGPDSLLVLNEYVYQPRSIGTFQAYLYSGAMRMVTGNMGRAETREISIDTPVASTAARGTDYWVGEIDGNFAVLLLEGEVVVSTDVGEAVLDEPGEGVTVFSRDQAPGDVRTWPDEKRERALAMVALD